jgi:hypothetical protein
MNRIAHLWPAPPSHIEPGTARGVYTRKARRRRGQPARLTLAAFDHTGRMVAERDVATPAERTVEGALMWDYLDAVDADGQTP